MPQATEFTILLCFEDPFGKFIFYFSMVFYLKNYLNLPKFIKVTNDSTQTTKCSSTGLYLVFKKKYLSKVLLKTSTVNLSAWLEPKFTDGRALIFHFNFTMLFSFGMINIYFSVWQDLPAQSIVALIVYLEAKITTSQICNICNEKYYHL